MSFESSGTCPISPETPADIDENHVLLIFADTGAIFSEAHRPGVIFDIYRAFEEAFHCSRDRLVLSDEIGITITCHVIYASRQVQSVRENLLFLYAEFGYMLENEVAQIVERFHCICQCKYPIGNRQSFL